MIRCDICGKLREIDDLKTTYFSFPIKCNCHTKFKDNKTVQYSCHQQQVIRCSECEPEIPKETNIVLSTDLLTGELSLERILKLSLLTICLLNRILQNKEVYDKHSKKNVQKNIKLLEIIIDKFCV